MIGYCCFVVLCCFVLFIDELFIVVVVVVVVVAVRTDSCSLVHWLCVKQALVLIDGHCITKQHL